ncbi:MAG: signal peptide peptidase SppA [Patescibacteria group bacterium]|jgi:protease-4
MSKEGLNRVATGYKNFITRIFRPRLNWNGEFLNNFRRYLGKCLGVLFGILVFFIFLSLVSLPFSKGSQNITTEKIISGGIGFDKIAVIPFKGEITSEESGLSQASGGYLHQDMILRQIKAAKEDGNVKAVLFKINSPGGEAVASAQIYDAIKDLSVTKETVAYIDQIAASGAYYAVIGAKKIVAYPHSIVGSIGVIMQVPNYTGVADKIGYKQIVLKSGEFKDSGSPWREMTLGDRSVIEAILNDSFDSLVGAVKAERNLDESKAKAISDGRIFTAKAAMEQNLVDEIATFDAALEGLKKSAHLSDPSVVEYETPKQNPLLNLLSAKLPISFSPSLSVPDSQMKILYK